MATACSTVVTFLSLLTICQLRNSYRGLKRNLFSDRRNGAEFNIFSPNKQETIILAPQMSADKDDASMTNASATRVTGRQRRHQRNVVDRAIVTRVTTPAVLSGREGGGGRRSADVVLLGKEGSSVRL